MKDAAKKDSAIKPNRTFYTDMPSNTNFLACLSNESNYYQPSSSISTPIIPESAVQALTSSESIDSWILDSGASTHFTHDLSNMFDYNTCDVRIEFGKGSAKALAYGSVRLTLVGDKTRTVTFSEVFYVPDLRANLLSTEKLRTKGLFYRNDKQILFTDDAVMANVYSHQRVPHIQIYIKPY